MFYTKIATVTQSLKARRSKQTEFISFRHVDKFTSNLISILNKT